MSKTKQPCIIRNTAEYVLEKLANCIANPLTRWSGPSRNPSFRRGGSRPRFRLSRLANGTDIDAWKRDRLAAVSQDDLRVSSRATLAELEPQMEDSLRSFLPTSGQATVGDSMRSIIGQELGSFEVAHEQWSTAFEFFNRRRLFRNDSSRPSFDNARFFTGEDPATFRAFVAAALGKETTIEKEKRKAPEARDVRDVQCKCKSGVKAPTTQIGLGVAASPRADVRASPRWS